MNDTSVWFIGLIFLLGQLVVFAACLASLRSIFDSWICQRKEARRQLSADVLANRYQEHPSIQLMSRMGTMAPLIGVIVTAYGFSAISGLATETAGTSDYFSVKPVFNGVVIGSGLALVNLLCVQVVQSAISRRVREAEEVEAAEDKDVGATDSLQQITTAVTNASMAVGQFAAVVGSATSGIDDLHSRLGSSYAEYTLQIQRASEVLLEGTKLVTASLSSSAEGHSRRMQILLEEQERHLSELSSRLELSSEKCAESIGAAGSDITGTARKLGEAFSVIGETFGTASDQLAATMVAVAKERLESASELRSAAHEVHSLTDAIDALHYATRDREQHATDVARSLHGACTQLEQFLNDELVPAAAQMRDHLTVGTSYVQNMAHKSAEGFSAAADTLHATATAMIVELKAAQEQVVGSTGSVHTLVEHSSNKLQLVGSELASALTRIEQAIEGMGRVAAAMPGTPNSGESHPDDQLRLLRQDLGTMTKVMVNLPAGLISALRTSAGGLDATDRSSLAAAIAGIQTLSSELKGLAVTMKGYHQQTVGQHAAPQPAARKRGWLSRLVGR